MLIVLINLKNIVKNSWFIIIKAHLEFTIELKNDLVWKKNQLNSYYIYNSQLLKVEYFK